jgi:hypothetical protein
MPTATACTHLSHDSHHITPSPSRNEQRGSTITRMSHRPFAQSWKPVSVAEKQHFLQLFPKKWKPVSFFLAGPVHRVYRLCQRKVGEPACHDKWAAQRELCARDRERKQWLIGANAQRGYALVLAHR